MHCCVFFFFSSRRRHTRLTCDWSSDVCSSDLITAGFSACNTGRAKSGRAEGEREEAMGALSRRDVLKGSAAAASGMFASRSEERRVGKECRSRWWPDQYKKKRTVRSV